MHFIRKLNKPSVLICLIFALLAASLIAPIASEIFISNLPNFVNHLAGLIQAKLALVEGQFPLRVAPLEQSGLRYPLFQFDSPTAYWIAANVYRWITPTNPLIALKVCLWATLWTGGLFMYRLTYWIVKSRPAATLAGLVYLTAPYYIIVVNHLGNLTEAMGLGIFPAILFYTLKCVEKPKLKYALIMSLGWYVLMTVHYITFVYASFFTACILLLIIIRHFNYLKPSLYVLLAYVFSCLLGLWYLAPLTVIRPLLAHINTSQFMSNSPLITYLLFPASAITPNARTLIETIHPTLGWPIVLAVAICVYAYFNKQSIMSIRARRYLPIFLFLFFIIVFLVWSPLNIWRFLPSLLMIGQYSWRLLDLAIISGTVLFAWSLCWLFQDNLNLKHVAIGALILAAVANTWFPESDQLKTSLADFIKNPLRMTEQNPYLLPANKNAAAPKNLLPLAQVQSHCHLEKNRTYCHLLVAKDILTLELPILYYPDLLYITLNHQPISYQSTADGNTVMTTIAAEPGQINDIMIEFRGLHWANQTSLLAWCLWLFGCVFIGFRTWVLREK